MKFNTRVVRFEAAPGDPIRPTNTPIYQTATFKFASAGKRGAYDYSRTSNPTRKVLEDRLADLENGNAAFVYSSGMAAVAAACKVVSAGEHILASDDLYGGTVRLLTKMMPKFGVQVSVFNATDLESLRASLKSNTRLVLMETLTNPVLNIIDLKAVSEIAHAAGALVAVDNSTLSPYVHRPLEHGADIVIYSGTKYLNGHGDVTGGAIIVKDLAIGKEIHLQQSIEGNALGPMDCYLLLRGLKTLAVRMDRQQQSAQQIAEFLASQPIAKRTLFPGLETHVRREIHLRQASGFGGLISFETGDVELTRKIVDAVRLFTIAHSFGSVTSTISIPYLMSHLAIPAEFRRGLSDNLIRISIGLEDANDLIADLRQAFEKSTA